MESCIMGERLGNGYFEWWRCGTEGKCGSKCVVW